MAKMWDKTPSLRPSMPDVQTQIALLAFNHPSVPSTGPVRLTSIAGGNRQREEVRNRNHLSSDIPKEVQLSRAKWCGKHCH